MEPETVKLKEIKPVLSGYLRISMSMLSRAPFPDRKTTHDVRVNMKKARAALRLISPCIVHADVRKDIRSLREVGRKMCELREAAIHRKNLLSFLKEYPEIFKALADNDKINMLLKKQEEVTDTGLFTLKELPDIMELLRKTGFRIRFYSVSRIDPTELIRNLEMTYAEVTDLYLAARNDPEANKLHEFRKRAKDLLYQLYYFRPLDPKSVKNLEKKTDTLTCNLGKYNDLAQLIGALDYNYSSGANLPAMDELIVVIKGRQDIYLSRIWSEAYKLFAPGRQLPILKVF
jgi:CHAD domain-containing protein